MSIFVLNFEIMIKLLIWVIVGFLVYRFFISPVISPQKKIENEKKSKIKGEYVDYEEIKEEQDERK